MNRRDFIKGSAIIGATIISPTLAHAASGLITSRLERKVYKVLKADKTKVGTLPIMRAFAGNHLDYVSPYVLFDEFGPVNLDVGSDPLRVNAHPHAGIIPTTYFLDGSGHHKDSLNYDFQVDTGEFMMFHSGKGAIHMEETGKKLHEEGGNYHGFQIWLNMPAKDKFIDPTTSVHKANVMPSLYTKDYTIQIILGSFGHTKSQIELRHPAFYYYIKLHKNKTIEIPVDGTDNVFVYGVKGKVELEGQKLLEANQIALYNRGNDYIKLYSNEGAEFLVLGGKPLNEPVFSYGPFVMNTEDEIKKCIHAYRSGEMGDPEEVNR